jgi:hypothetical protein
MISSTKRIKYILTSLNRERYENLTALRQNVNLWTFFGQLYINNLSMLNISSALSKRSNWMINYIKTLYLLDLVEY